MLTPVKDSYTSDNEKATESDPVVFIDQNFIKTVIYLIKSNINFILNAKKTTIYDQ